MPDAGHKHYDDAGSTYSQARSHPGNLDAAYHLNSTTQYPPQFEDQSVQVSGMMLGPSSAPKLSQDKYCMNMRDKLGYVPLSSNSDYTFHNMYKDEKSQQQQQQASDLSRNSVIYSPNIESRKRDHAHLDTMEDLIYGYKSQFGNFDESSAHHVPEKLFKYSENEERKNQNYHPAEREVENASQNQNFKPQRTYTDLVGDHSLMVEENESWHQNKEIKNISHSTCSPDSHAILRSTLLQKDDLIPLKPCPQSYPESVSSKSAESRISSVSQSVSNTASTSRLRSLEQRSHFLVDSLLECDHLLDISDLFQTQDLLSSSKEDVTKLLCDLGDKIVGKLIKWTKHLTFFKEIPIEAHSQLLSSKWHELLLLITTAYKAVHGQRNNGMTEEELYIINLKHIQVQFKFHFSR